MRIKIADITMDPDVQVREHLDASTVERYAEMLEASEPPPVTVWGAANLLSDGAHRVAAANRAGREDIEADWHEGTKEDAIEHAASANSRHGLPLTANERRIAATHLLKLGKTQQEVATAVGMAQRPISALATSLQLKGEYAPPSRKGRGQTKRRLEPLPEDVRDLPASTLEHVAAAPEERRVEIARYAKDEGLTERETRAIVKAVNRQPDIDLRDIRKRAVDAAEASDPWIALHAALQAGKHLGDFDIDDLAAQIRRPERAVWLAQLDENIDILQRIRATVEVKA